MRSNACVEAWLAGCLLILCAAAPATWDNEIAVQGRSFPQSAIDPAQRGHDLSLSLQTEYSTDWDQGRQEFLFKPFLRLDSADSARTHFDLREAVWIDAGDDWEVRLGIDKVYWGVTEVDHLVDIVNQTDLLENPDGEQKLGQPMLKYSAERDWGTLDLYLMPWFRERNFAGRHGRLRSQPRVDTGQARYDSPLKRHYPSLAIRWSDSIGPWDIGLSGFHGTSREPRLTPGLDAAGRPVLIPHYDTIDQLSLDLQATLGDWLWKLEAIHRGGQGQGYGALTGGFEYTQVGIAETRADLGLLAEFMLDGRGDSATTPFNHDVFAGLRWTANDEAGSELLTGVLLDWENGTRFYNLEASRRIGEDWKARLQVRIWQDVDARDISRAFARDDYVEAQLTRYF
jgi:hypothetical protein